MGGGQLSNTNDKVTSTGPFNPPITSLSFDHMPGQYLAWKIKLHHLVADCVQLELSINIRNNSPLANEASRLAFKVF